MSFTLSVTGIFLVVLTAVISSNPFLLKFKNYDKPLHALGFFMIVILAYHIFQTRIRKHALVLAVIISTLLAFGTEFFQKYQPTRTFNPRDLYANVAGIAGAMVVLLLFKTITCRRSDTRRPET